jgi:hypothetical protein
VYQSIEELKDPALQQEQQKFQKRDPPSGHEKNGDSCLPRSLTTAELTQSVIAIAMVPSMYFSFTVIGPISLSFALASLGASGVSLIWVQDRRKISIV